jgi:hypothetical protein
VIVASAPSRKNRYFVLALPEYLTDASISYTISPLAADVPLDCLQTDSIPDWSLRQRVRESVQDEDNVTGRGGVCQLLACWGYMLGRN